MSDNNQLIEKFHKTSYLLGIVYGSLNQMVDNSGLAEFQKEPLLKLLNIIEEGINKIYYEEESKE